MEQRLRVRYRHKLVHKSGLLPLKGLELGVHCERVRTLNDGFDQLVDLIGHLRQLFLKRFLFPSEGRTLAIDLSGELASELFEWSGFHEPLLKPGQDRRFED